ncbi:MAG TPA: hypothetical protein VHT04_15325 [Stellaceae bacterium]|jgi:hypothetical protein|nr:hypothetical protein [Stellaceae bacterium]
MAIPADIANALHGAWRLARFDRSGAAFFEHSERAFWRSFLAALIAFPAFLLFLPLGSGDVEAGTIDWMRVFLVETIAYVIGWTAFPLVILPVTRFLGREAAWLDFIIVYNWSQVLQYGLILAVIGLSLSGLVPPLLATLLLYLAYVAVFAYEGFIARIMLDISWPAAGMIVLIDLVVGRLISMTAESLH